MYGGREGGEDEIEHSNVVALSLIKITMMIMVMTILMIMMIMMIIIMIMIIKTTAFQRGRTLPDQNHNVCNDNQEDDHDEDHNEDHPGDHDHHLE